MNLETKVIWTYVKNGLNLDLKKFFDDWNLPYQQEIVVYQNMQNEKKLINKSQYRVFVLFVFCLFSGIQWSIFPKRRLYFWPTSQVIFFHVCAFKQTCFQRWDQSDFLLRWICLKSVILKFGIFCLILQYFLIFKTQVPLRLASLWLNKTW